MSTRFHPDELAALDRLVEEEGFDDRCAALRACVAGVPAPSTTPTRRALGTIRRAAREAVVDLRLPRRSLEGTEVIDDTYSDDLAAHARALRASSGCRTLFAVPRYALAHRLGRPEPTRFSESFLSS